MEGVGLGGCKWRELDWGGGGVSGGSWTGGGVSGGSWAGGV